MATFGYSSWGASTYSQLWANEKCGCKFTLPESGNVTSITALVRDYAESGKTNALRYGIYDANNVLKGQTNIGNLPAGFTWVTLDFPSALSLSAGDYWLCPIVLYRTEINYDAGDAGQWKKNSDTFSDGFSDPFGSPSETNAWKQSIYATYTPSGATYTKTWTTDTLFKKLGITRAFGIDAYFGPVGALTHTKSFALDAVFAYKVRLPEIWLDEEGKIVLNVSRPYVWVGS